MKRFLLIALALVLALGMSATAFAAPSNWAQAEVDRAVELELVPEALLSNFQTAITRADFCILIMTLVDVQLAINAEEANGEEAAEENGAEDALVNPFEDTDLEAVVRAFDLGIVYGRSDTVFAPNDNISRQEAAIMLQRAFRVIGTIEPLIGTVITFEDAASIAAWASEGVNFAVRHDIMRGTSVDPPMFSPAGAYTREQAILTTLRLFYLVNGLVAEVVEVEEADEADEDDDNDEEENGEEEADEDDDEEENGDDE